ncbi:DUF6538 domain-containing protein [Devosia sp. A449]
MPKKTDYLERRGAVYQIRLPVPADLQATFGKVIRHTLETKDFGEAKTLVQREASDWRDKFEEARAARTLTDDDLDRAAWQHYSRELEIDQNERHGLPTQADIDAKTQEIVADVQRQQIDLRDQMAMVGPRAELQAFAGKAKFNHSSREARAKIAREQLASGETVLIEWSADDFIARNHLNIVKGSPQYRALCQRLQRADLQALDRTFERDQGNFHGQPSDPTLIPVVSEGRAKAPAGESIMELFGRYAADNENGIRPETLSQQRRDVQLFADFLSPRVPVEKITRRLCGDFKDLLLAYPVRAAEINAFKGMTPQQVVEANKTVGKPALSRITVNKTLSSLSSFFKWLAPRGRLPDGNPVSGLMTKPKGKDAPIKRTTFTTAQLTTLFNSPLFTGAASSEKWSKFSKPGDHVIRDHRYWIWLVMLYSGARPGEIAQLELSDFDEQGGIWFMHIADQEENQRVKPDASRRRVPIHSELVRLGLRDLHTANQRAGHQQLFPELETPEVGQIAAQFSRESNRYLTATGIKTDRRLVTYSLRHTFIDQARVGGFMNEQIALVVGHDESFGPRNKVQTEGYGQLQHGTLQHRQSIVESVKYPSLELDHLITK